ncbi:Na/Pi cotransporter family protein [Aureliella helgolandensis]|uniref:Na+/Pi-cotransporter n=1 Tax=Aureliella helgolandensis TaxID=2527968 RepID=A0A518GHJ5_9BACT|nr:Na/Pi cotransporter family protein [Aureliella helgolandensis]QDV28063.1 Na+/Pi-cotransporter [Aureliella helgolandensis]
MDTEALTKLVFELVGGLGIFLLGMKNMSDGMQAVAGSSLRRLIGAVTNNRFLAISVGVIVTCVVQSSSITTVMVVGFVNSGVMELAQGVGVIMGANIGTTITGWILVLKIGKYGLPLLGIAAFAYLFSRGDRIRYLAMTVLGIGMVFFGLEVMKDACSTIKDLPDFEAWFHKFNADNYLGVLKCALAGCVLTTMVQSSSATLGITISLATQGIISYPTAAALVLGENIGTTITAFLASLGTTTNARRAAYFHVAFNLFGVFWITLVFPWYIDLIQMILGPNITEAVVVDGKNTYPHTVSAIAATHTIFNIANTLLFVAFVPLIVKVLIRVVPGKPFKEKSHLTDLDVRILDSPLMAIEQSRKEIIKMSDGCMKMLAWQVDLLQQDSPDKTLADRLKHREKVLDSVQDEVSNFVTHLLSSNVSHETAAEGRQQMRMADEYESISDYIASLDKFDRKLRRDGFRFTEIQRSDLGKLNQHLAEYLGVINEALRADNHNVLAKSAPLSRRIRDEIKALRRKNLEVLSAGETPPLVIVAYLASLNAFTRIRDHIQNVAETIADKR